MSIPWRPISKTDRNFLDLNVAAADFSPYDLAQTQPLRASSGQQWGPTEVHDLTVASAPT
jgi:hypothetical protein